MNKKIEDISNLLSNLPGVSTKIAERLSISLIEDENLVKSFEEITNITKTLKKDELTGLIINNDEIPNENKEKDVLLIINSNNEIKNIINKTNTNKSIFILDMKNKRDFKTTEFVLKRLFKVVKMYNTKEILFLLSPSIESELIMRVIKEEIIKIKDIEQPKLTRLSMGIPFGGSIEFSDERTIREAMEKREKA